MLIWIDSSVLTADLKKDHDACQGLNDVFSSVYRGEHFALADRAVLISLSHNENLSSPARLVIRKVISEFATTYSISSKIAPRIKIIHGKHDSCAKVDETTWEISAGKIGKSGVMKSVVICENLLDIKLLLLAAKQYMARAKITCSIALDKCGGGGSTTPECFRNSVLDEARWGLCIPDSDRLCPEQEPDATAIKCKEIADGGTVVARVVDILFREIENIIPIAFLSEIIPPTHADVWDRHKNILFPTRPDAHKFGDLKKGTRLDRIFKYKPGSAERKFWNSVAEDFIKIGELRDECFVNGSCQRVSKPDGCECSIIPGYGDNILGSTIKVLEGRSLHKSVEALNTDDSSSAWLDLGAELFNWGCAPLRIRS